VNTVPTNVSTAAVKRYKDAYRVARFVNGIGLLLKITGFCTAAIFLLAVFFLLPQIGGTQDTELRIMAVFVAFFVAFLIVFFFFVWGILVSARGQALKALLDSAVNTSPFLDNPLKAQAMSLH
jgi:hypothetical protein